MKKFINFVNKWLLKGFWTLALVAFIVLCFIPTITGGYYIFIKDYAAAIAYFLLQIAVFTGISTLFNEKS